jgi:RNA polymerase sigma factor (sigma-70 family)
MRTADGYIVKRCLNGDSAAFGLLVDKYKEGVYSLAYSKLRNFHDAEDVTQEVFIKAYRKLRTLRRYDDFHAWIYAITSNLCKDWIRSRSSRPDCEFIADQTPEALQDSPVDSHIENPLIELLHEALDSLPEIYRQILTLYYLGGMNSREIAEFLGMSPATVRQRLTRARSQLREGILTMMKTAFEEQRLQVGFTFRIVEAVKQIKIQPMPRATALPWGLSLATGLIFTIMSFSPHLSILNSAALPSGLPLPIRAKVLKTGEIPVDIMDFSQISVVASNQADDDSNPEFPGSKNAPLLAPQAAIGKWVSKSNMPTARSSLATSAADGRIYAIGGASHQEVLSTIEEYDPETDTWTKKSDMPIASCYLSASILNGKIYVTGGWNVSVLSAVMEYNPVADKWMERASMLTSRDGLSTSTVNGKIYAIGGWEPMIALPTVEEYDPVADKWTKKADMPTARWGHSTSVVNGKIYAIGGRFGTFNQGPAFSAVEEYDPATDKWTKKADMPTARWGLSASVLNGKIYAIGGSVDDTNALSVVEVYDPVTNTWAKGPGMQTGRLYFSTSTIDGKIYAVGGQTAGGVKTSSVEELDMGFEAVEAKGKRLMTWGMIKGEVDRKTQ